MMRIVFFYPSLLSDWGNNLAHDLRGLSMELLLRGHEVVVYEPRDARSLRRLLAEHGHGPVARFHRAYPGLASRRYELQSLNLNVALAQADLVVVHQHSDPRMVRAIGWHHALGGGYRLFWHATQPATEAGAGRYDGCDLRHYDGVLAGCRALRDDVLARGAASRAWIWHDAADTRLFKPGDPTAPEGDVVWVGDWGEGERLAELREFLMEPVRASGLKARVYGAGYTPQAVDLLAEAGIEYGGWVPNFEMPQVLARYRITVHIPSRASGSQLGQVLQAMACGRPVICGAGADPDGLMQAGVDFGLARDRAEMIGWLRRLLDNSDQAHWMASHGRATMLNGHTCSHRADELLGVLDALPLPAGAPHLGRQRLPLAV